MVQNETGNLCKKYILCHGKPNQNSYRQKSQLFFSSINTWGFAILPYFKYLYNAFDSQRYFLSHETKFARLA